MVGDHVNGEQKRRRGGPLGIDDLGCWGAVEWPSTGAAGNVMDRCIEKEGLDRTLSEVDVQERNLDAGGVESNISNIQTVFRY